MNSRTTIAIIRTFSRHLFTRTPALSSSTVFTQHFPISSSTVFHYRHTWSKQTALNSNIVQSSPKRHLCSSSSDPPPLKFHMVFTCAKCETRAVKSFTKNAYEKGVVIITCPGCESRHLIADNLGWFGADDESNIEKILAKKGQSVTTVTDNDIDYTPKT